MTILITEIFIGILLCVAAGYIARIVGPCSPVERAIAFDGFATTMACCVAILCVRLKSSLYFDAVLVFTLLGFIGSVALAKYLEKGNIF